MTKTNKTTKRALVLSALALLVCISMFIGSTFAWFTDSVVSGTNKIVAGNLDVVLEYKTDYEDDWKVVDENTKIFKEGALYEPGYTEVVFLRVSNAGSLALKYQLMVNIANEKASTNVYGEEFKLSDYLQIGSYSMDEYNGEWNYGDILMPIFFGTRESALANVNNLAPLSSADSIVKSNSPLLAGDKTSSVVALVLTMPETVGDVANHKTGVAAPEIDLGVSLIATQLTEEKDSFGPDYDEDAEYPAIITNAAELKDALTNGGSYVLAKNISADADETITIPEGVTSTLNLNGKTLAFVTDDADNDDDGKFTSKDNEIAIDVRGTLTVKNGTITTKHESDNMGWNAMTEVFYVGFNGTLNVENATIENLGGSDMAYAIDVVNATNATLNVKNSTLNSTYIPVRIFNNSNGMNNVTIEDTTLEGVSRAFWVHIYTDEDNGGKGVKDSTLNLDIYGNGNTFKASNPNRIIEFGFTNPINFDAEGNQI